ncbi:MAG: transcriptional repressor [Candidatus Pelagibacter sp. TMED275]|nr:MAG: transcriptional repressor [Candidatus Pelagibacter sp. TMED275]
MKVNSKYTNKLRSSGIRPTRQRIKICEVLFERDHTFHFSINDLVEIIKNKTNEKIALATVYNTIHSLTKKGYLKEISINSDKSYFDTNTSTHHHFFDEETSELIDLEDKDVDPVNIRKGIPGKKIKSIEVLVKVDNDNQNQE